MLLHREDGGPEGEGGIRHVGGGIWEGKRGDRWGEGGTDAPGAWPGGCRHGEATRGKGVMDG